MPYDDSSSLHVNPPLSSSPYSVALETELPSMSHSDKTEQSSLSRRVSKGIWVSYPRQAEAQALSVCVHGSAWKDAIYIGYEIQLCILLPSGKKKWNHKSSFVPDVRTKCSAYLISVSDMCFECETLVSPPAELSVLASPFMSDVHRLPLLRWYPQEVQSCLEESSESGKFLYLEARVIFFFF